MDRRSDSTKAREQLLHIEEAKYFLRPVVPPVALERKFISMLNPSMDSHESVQQSRSATTTDMTSSTTVTTAPSLSPTSTTSVPRVAQISPPLSATTTPTTATKSAPEAASIVGGKRPLGEESPVIILVQQQDDKEKEETPSDLPGSDSTSRQNQSAQEQPHLRKQKPEETVRKLSTGESTSERGKELGSRKRGKHGVQFSDVSPKRDVSDVMQFFQEQEKNLQERFLSLPKKSQKKQRSPSPKLQHAPGLEHLDNLIRLMEQLTSLKDENSRLRKRCDYLESTKILLQAKRDLALESSSSSSGFMTLPPSDGQHEHHLHHSQHPHEKDTISSNVDPLRLRESGSRLTRPRISSAEEIEYIQIADSSSDQAPKKVKATMHKRSFSTGSLEVPSEIATEVGRVDTRKRIKAKSGRSIFSKSSDSKQKSKSSKWARVKKVLTGQKLYEDLGTTIRTIRELGRSSHSRYSTAGAEEFSSTSSRVSSGMARSAVSHTHEVYGARVPLAAGPTFVTESALQKFQEVEDADLTSEIWMGPPDWWQEYEARKESGGTSTTSEVSSVIEVTTMYLGSKKESTTPATTSVTSAATSPTISTTTAQDKYLTIDKPLTRRQSSPSLVMKESTEEDDILQELATGLESTRILHKSASCKSADLDILILGEGRQTKKSHRSAWGRVKDIIHTRKDSIKKRPKRGKSGLDSEETSEIDVEGLSEEPWRSDVFDDGLLSRSTPKSSPMVIRQHGSKGPSESYLGAGTSIRKVSPSRGATVQLGTSPGNIDMAALLAGSMSDEFNKKMLEWEQIRGIKPSSVYVSLEESESLDVSATSHEFPVRTVDLRDLRGKVSDISSDGVSHDESHTPTPMEALGAPSVNLEEIQRRMTGSFSRKMQEWEKLKYKGSPGVLREPSPDTDRKEIKGRKDDRQKSKRSREEKEKEKWERQREREMQKVEREQVKLEKEKLRIEKERLRTLEREAKLEKLKGRLSQVESEGRFKNPALSPLAEYKVTAEFARKLHEWELKKGLSHDVSNSIYREAQKIGMQHLRRGGRLDSLSKQAERYPVEGSSQTEARKKAPPPPPLTLQPYWDSPEDTSPIERYSEVSMGDGDDDTCTSMTEECLTRSKISTLERANTQLLENLQKKEQEYAAVHEEVQKVTEKLAKVRENHAAEMARFHRELAKGNFSGPVKLEVEQLETTVGDLEEKIQMMENFGEKMASSMESAAIGKWQSIEGEETVHTQLVELVDQMRGMLLQASQSEEQSQKTMALTNFETLYTQAMKLQVQMNNLRLSHLERNREIMIIKRQLLLQEVNNLLLQADITRRETELYQFHEAKRFASLKRWNTFSGTERHRPQAQIDLASTSLKPRPHREPRVRPTTETPCINIPHIPEELILASAASSSISAPASPLCIAATGDPSTSPSISDAGQSLPGAAHEQSTDHLETHMILTPHTDRRDHQLELPVGASLSQYRSTDLRYVSGGHESSTSLQLPKLAINVVPLRKHPGEQHLSTSAVAPSETKTPITTISQPSLPTSAVPPLTYKTEHKEKQERSPPVAAAIARISSREISTKRVSTPKLSITTICDSAPLHLELKELRREKRKVEKGPPTLKRSESEGFSSVPSPGKVPRQSSTLEAPNQSIPKQRSLEKPRLTKVAPIVDDDYSPEPSVMKCTETLTVIEQTDSELGAVGGVSLQPPAAETTGRDLPHTSDQSYTGSVSLQSPVSRHILLSQKEERDNQLKSYHAVSPKGSPVASRGKPPLPRHATPAKQSPSVSSTSEKGPRSKSVSDVDDRVPASTISKSLQDAIKRFDKRATVCETEDRPVELRKTPSPTLHLPRVGLVSRVRRLKPAAELLEESHRYRSGHSIYATRILQRYISKDDHKPDSSETAQNKENLSGTYVHAIVQRLSRESTPVRSAGPSRTNSDLSLKRADSPGGQSEFVTDIVRKLSSPSEPEAHKCVPPLRDLTNEGQVRKLTQAYNGHTLTRSQERTLSDSDIIRQHDDSSTSATKTQNRKSCEVPLGTSSYVMPMSETVYQVMPTKAHESEGDSSPKPGSTTTPISYQSLPAITRPSYGELSLSVEEASRGRAATYCVSEIDKAKSTSHDESTDPQPSSSQTQEYTGDTATSKSAGRAGLSSREKVESGRLPSSLSPDRRGAGRGKMGTVGVLCKQSISFDLGVSLYSQKSPTGESIPKSRQARSWDPSESARAEATAAGGSGTPSTTAAAFSPMASSSSASEGTATGDIRPVSTSSEGEGVPSSPPTAEKKRSRRFLDSSWLQKSKKFFKVSK